MDLHAQQRRNQRMTWLLMAGFAGLFLAVGLALDTAQSWELARTSSGKSWPLPIYSGLALLLAGAGAAYGYRHGDQLILRSVGARPLDLAIPEERRLFNVVEEMALASGMPVPRVYLLPDPDPNAMATGRSPDQASLGVTQGLLGMLERDELQAVVAHEMGHIRNLDIRLMLVVSVLLGTIALLSDMATRQQALRHHRRSDQSNGGNGILALVALVMALVAPLVARLLAMAVSRTREYEADRSAAEYTRNPQALASALEKLEAHAAPTRVATQGTAHLFMVDPGGNRLNEREGALANLMATHPPIRRRIERLREMGYVATPPLG